MNMLQIGGTISATLIAATLVAQDNPRPPAENPAKAPASSTPQIRPSAQPALTWLTDFQKAKTQAKAEGKSILLFFHGSDWCPPCVQMQRQVIDSPEFAQFARQSLVLVDVDFPEKSKQSEELKRANLALKAKFNLSPELGEGFPTLVLLSESGETVFQETGYAGGGPAEVLPSLRRHTVPAQASGTSTGFRNLTVDEFAQMTTNKANVILDVRTAEEYKSGHIPGALNIDVNAGDFKQKVAALDKSKTYLVHCASGGRSVTACESLGRLDFPKLYNLPGGFRAWVKAGKPVEK
jgi:rhodanese-related sulfurtransferase/thiol-disulfide isomerase/thioredoxin